MKQTMKTLKALFCLMLILFGLTAALPEASALSYGFPLPGGKYTVTALNKYSDGSWHKSYINQYVLKKGATPTDNVIDIAAKGGTPIYAVADGTVITNTYGSGGGYYVVIKHSLGNGKYSYSYYGHMMAQSPIAKGKSVKKGQQIGKVGKTGTASGNHLHFELSNADPYCLYSGYWKGLSGAAAKRPHHHECTSFDKLGKCTVCGKQYQYKITSLNKKGTMTACTWLYEEPYSASRSLCDVNTKKLIHVIGSAKNALGQTWYRIEYDTGRSCVIGWISASCIKLK